MRAEIRAVSPKLHEPRAAPPALDTDPAAFAAQLHLTAYNPDASALLGRPAAVAGLHAAGVAVMAWTVDSDTTWNQLDALGVDGIITNRPAELAGWNSYAH
ncbi:glycerophosphodiester phosphodiesterase family protein [Catellatospora sp. KI3]|uniref:glycerophosphodiester phosphodiesterase n=1 Tax=Catellatospora sp. KI3 TaxID=3041620 RepID=UPI002482D226|nr:glycerophosphodiester phosphodiesterase family protein [Catellatospora sp. KI3]MDI1463020.1 glycerophosphodiester phosphodiesterase family protein [Catellatospora sp. KI3]